MELSKLVSFFKEDFFIPELHAQTKEEVLEELVKPLLIHGKIKNQDLLLETLKKRETLGSTGIGKGVAVPHCRSSIISEIHIVVGVSENGLPYDAIDKKDVHLFFMIIAPPQDESNYYLPILGKIVELLRNSKIRKSLRKVNDYSSFLQVLQRG